MVEPQSPLGEFYRPGRYGNLTGEPNVILTLPWPGSIVEVACWPGKEKALLDSIKRVTGLTLASHPGAGVSDDKHAAFSTAPGRFLVIDADEGLSDMLAPAVAIETGTVTDLSHGRTAIRISGAKAEWVLAKFFALDFSLAAFAVSSGKSTAHHDIFAAIQRTGAERFDIYVYRSFARAFWRSLCRGAEEVGYEVK